MEGSNVRLFRARTDDVERQLHELGVEDEEGLVLLVEFCVLFLERASKGKNGSFDRDYPLPTVSSLPFAPFIEGEKASSVLSRTLSAVHAYTSQGSLGGVSSQVCDLLQPLLVRLTKILLSAVQASSQIEVKNADYPASGGYAILVALNRKFSIVHDSERELSSSISLNGKPDEKQEDSDDHDVTELLDSLSLAMTSCAGGAARREADAVLEMNIKTLLSSFPSDSGDEKGILSVTFGFADYADCETAADLWGGSMSLSLFLMEQWKTLVVDFHKSVHERRKRTLRCDPLSMACSSLTDSSNLGLTHRIFRVLELGCGTGLVSLVFVKRLVHHIQHQCKLYHEEDKFEGIIEVHVTDLCSSAVDQVYRSFVEKNGNNYESVVFKTYTAEQVSRGEVPIGSDASTKRKSESAAVEVHLYPLDMCHVPNYLHQNFDLILAGDIIYDYQTVPHVYPSLTRLLAAGSPLSCSVTEPSESGNEQSFSGGVAILCCESHRDGMRDFVAVRNEQEKLQAISYIEDVRVALNHFSLLEELCSTMCSVLMLQTREVSE